MSAFKCPNCGAPLEIVDYIILRCNHCDTDHAPNETQLEILNMIMGLENPQPQRIPYSGMGSYVSNPTYFTGGYVNERTGWSIPSCIIGR